MAKARNYHKSKAYKKLKEKMFSRCDGLCFYCKVPLDKENKDSDAGMTLDHLIPRSHGGKDTKENCVVCCRKCNQLRRDTNIREFAAKHYPWLLYPKVKNDEA